MRGVLGLNIVDARGNIVDGNTDSLDKETKTVLLYIYTCKNGLSIGHSIALCKHKISFTYIAGTFVHMLDISDIYLLTTAHLP